MVSTEIKQATEKLVNGSDTLEVAVQKTAVALGFTAMVFGDRDGAARAYGDASYMMLAALQKFNPELVTANRS